MKYNFAQGGMIVQAKASVPVSRVEGNATVSLLGVRNSPALRDIQNDWVLTHLRDCIDHYHYYISHGSFKVLRGSPRLSPIRSKTPHRCVKGQIE